MTVHRALVAVLGCAGLRAAEALAALLARDPLFNLADHLRSRLGNADISHFRIARDRMLGRECRSGATPEQGAASI